jgi:hypothetical protein
MSTQPPCIILHSVLFECYEAFNEDGRLIGRRGSWEHLYNLVVTCFGYDNVPLNSRCGRMIRDKVFNKHPF